MSGDDERHPGGRKQRRLRGPVGSGVTATGAWVPEFVGQREPFAAGNMANLRHGGRSVVALQPRAHEIADDLRPLVPGYMPADDVLVLLLALSLARVEAMVEALAGMREGVREPTAAGRLRQELRAQSHQAQRMLSELGMTPASRARLARDVAGARHTDALRDHLQDNYPTVVIDAN